MRNTKYERNALKDVTERESPNAFEEKSAKGKKGNLLRENVFVMCRASTMEKCRALHLLNNQFLISIE
ncbi:CLUMA_CG016593, isoform A [Clunio marinus]|uniref:CLUMA_CG016593, isoform A n=1 Tax=Clunio marinus TaxID=568069 RepID=A0A1J1IWZ3_9DIPT|nr:CLUMA_CG016593, isoform A [Clunio marinus]